MSRRLYGAHYQLSTQSAIESARRARADFIKIMDPDTGPLEDLIRRQQPNSYLILRKWYHPDHQQAMRNDGPQTARTVVLEMLDHFNSNIQRARSAGIPVYAEGFNEPTPHPYDSLPRLSRWYAAFAAECFAVGLLPLAYSWSEGNPPSYGWAPELPQFPDYPASLKVMWRELLPGLEACVNAGGGLAMHVYDWPSLLDDPYWQGLRWLNDFDAIAANDPQLAARTDLFITEFGIDIGVHAETQIPIHGERKGWRTALKNDGAELARQVAAYRHEVLGSRWGHRVRGIFWFGIACEGSWNDYSVENVPEYEQVAATEPEGAPMPPTGPKPTVITALNRPAGRPGEWVRFMFTAQGVDGLNKTIADISYPPLPNDPESTYGPNQTTQLEAFADGVSHSVAVQIPPATTPLPPEGVVASLHFRWYENDGTPANTDLGISGPFAIDVFSGVHAGTIPTPVQPSAGQFLSDDVREHYDHVYASIIDLESDPDAGADDLKFKRDVLELIKWRKGEVPYPFK